MESVDIPIKHADGTIRTLLWNSANIYGQDGKTLVSIIAQGQDITERKLAKDQTEASLIEKELRLKEIHHRVKNNLQVIKSLLSLQSRQITDEKTLDLFTEVQNRVMSMALVHEKLYGSGDFTHINLSEYVKTMTQRLFGTYNVNRGMITLKTSIDDILLDVDKAVPCGLIIGELISNAFKYAFPDGRQGEVVIEFHKDDDSMLHLIVSDNGVGIPKDLVIDSPKTFGLWLVKILTEQLGGHVEIEHDGGTRVRLDFKEKEPKDRPASSKRKA